MGGVVVLLLIASANVANLLLARAAAREREIAVRMAIGAARQRLVRQLVTESLLLALLGAAFGLALAHWGTAGLVALIQSDATPIALDLALSARVLGFTLLVAVATALTFGLVPAWRGTRVSPQAAMKSGGRGVAEGGHRRFTVGKALVVAQVALSLVLLVGAGLLVGSLRKLSTMDYGFSPDGVLVADASYRSASIPRENTSAVTDDLLARVRAVPGVLAAATVNVTPVSGSSWNNAIFVNGYTPASEYDNIVWFNDVSAGYFPTMDIRLLSGRDFDATDVPESPKSAIVSQSVARKFFGGDTPIGRQFRTRSGDDYDPPYTVVGVVEDAKYRAIRETNSGTIYLAASQEAAGGRSGVTMLIRTAAGASGITPSIRRVFTQTDRAITLQLSALDDQLADSLRRERVLAILSALFGGVALALSMLGLYGVMAYNVARRRNEIGVRIALGADNGRVLRMVLGDVARVVAIGLVIGTAGALASGKLVASFLYGVTPGEPAVLALAAATLALVALGAGFIPAWRASRVDPVAALREE
jgi:predicted permease